MLSKKQYGLTLLTAVIVFFVMLAGTAWYFSQRNWTGRSEYAVKEKSELEVETEKPKELTILPQTKITLKVEDRTTNKETKTTVNAASLLGLTEDELAERFEDYTVETFNEKEVCLTKEMSSEETAVRDAAYVLGVENDCVCIKEKDSAMRPVKIDYSVNHLSSYIYSILLNEEIEITKDQKEALLLNPSTLQKILQDYVGE